MTLTEFDRPDRLVVVAVNDRMEIDTTYTFAEADGGTRLVVATEVEPKGVTSLLFPLLRLPMRREVAKKYATVKQIIESQPDAS